MIFVLSATVAAADIRDHYRLETIPTPKGLSAETGGLAFSPSGKLYACFHRGEVYRYDPQFRTWSLFAQGLHDPLGLLAISDREMLVMQRPELTRLRDTDGDGMADDHQALTADFGLSGNYHEFAFGPVRDAEGNLYIALNTASNGAGVRHEMRGTPHPLGRPGRMYAHVPYRGWVMKLTPDGKLLPFASGLRSPNGLGLDARVRLFGTDNQGDWVGTSKLYHVREGRFYGHVASLIWRPGWKRDPLKVPVDELQRLRTRAAVLLPQGVLANSPTQPLLDDTGGKFGPFAGQMIVGEMNHPRLLRLMLEEVGGELQGAATTLYDGAGLRRGNNRLAFGPDGSLWVGQTDHGWAGSKGIQKLTFTGRTPMDVSAMRLTETGFTLHFTRPLERNRARETKRYRLRRYAYAYHRSYGSDQKDRSDVAVHRVEVAGDGRQATLHLESLQPGFVYELRLDDLRAEDGAAVLNPTVFYTLNRLLDGTPAPSARPAPQPNRFVLRNDHGVFEAESAAVTGAKISKQHAGFEGDGYVDFEHPRGDRIVWRLALRQAGRFRLTFRYASADDRPLHVSLNGQALAEPLVFKKTGGWSDWSTLDVTAELQAGDNDLSLETRGRGGPNVDRLEVRRAD